MMPQFNYSVKIQFRRDQLFLGIEEVREATEMLLALASKQGARHCIRCFSLYCASLVFGMCVLELTAREQSFILFQTWKVQQSLCVGKRP